MKFSLEPLSMHRVNAVNNKITRAITETCTGADISVEFIISNKRVSHLGMLSN